ncbi:MULTISPECIES: sensor histidine kinase [Actinoalloteichus]|uniref:sensor histidine kinase n=1 Tax=Actinoalloteichus TaxID=65496 RepID=UPI0012F89F6F|nr:MULTISPECIES: histidine kinase [Actinoalloteichus]
MTTEAPTRNTDKPERLQPRALIRVATLVLLTGPDRLLGTPRPRMSRLLRWTMSPLVTALLLANVAFGVSRLDPLVSSPGPGADAPLAPVPQLALLASAGICAFAFFRPLIAWRLATATMVGWVFLFHEVLGDLLPFWSNYLTVMFLVAFRHAKWIAVTTATCGFGLLLSVLPLAMDEAVGTFPVTELLLSGVIVVLLGGVLGRFRTSAVLQSSPTAEGEDPEGHAERRQREELAGLVAETGRAVRSWARTAGALLSLVLISGTDTALARRGHTPRRWRRQVRVPLIAAYALTVTIAGVDNFADQQDTIWPEILAFAGGGIAVLAFVLPMVAWRASILAIVTAFVTVPADLGRMLPMWVVVLTVLFLVAYRHTARIVLVILAVTCVVVWISAALAERSWGMINLGGVLVSAIVVALLAYSLGSAHRARRDLAAEEQRTSEAQAEQVRLSERNRIAREMHDVVAHHMSMIAVRSETAPYRLPDLSESGRQEIAEIGEAARAAMSDMQRLLGVLRDADHQPARAPQPGLNDLADLVATSGDSGMPVTMSLPDGLEQVVGEALGLTAYRIVQEALTNASRYAPNAPIRIDLTRDGAKLIITVRNEPPSEPPQVAVRRSGGGHGLTGMRERVDLHRGTLTAGPTASGGFQIRAVLPLTDDAPSDDAEE